MKQKRYDSTVPFSQFLYCDDKIGKFLIIQRNGEKFSIIMIQIITVELYKKETKIENSIFLSLTKRLILF